MRHFGNILFLVVILANALCTLLLLLVAYSPHITPTVHPVESCMGLTFPIFLVLNGCFLLFWLVVQKYKAALLPLTGFLLCTAQIRLYIPINFRTDALPEASFKLLSYNIMGFNGATKQADGTNPILTYLQKSGADILCLQEYITIEDKRHLTQHDVEQALKAYPYHRILSVGHNKGANKMACYSKFPILSARTLSYPSDYNGSVLYELKIGNDTVTLINNHLESNKLTLEDKAVYTEMLKDPEKEKVKSGLRLLVRKLAEASAIRAVQADSIASHIARRSHPALIVCGDFNDTPISYTHRVIARGLDDAFAQSGRGLGISYNQNNFYFRIDNILTSKELRSYNCMVDRSIRESDHYPIACYLSLQKK